MTKPTPYPVALVSKIPGHEKDDAWPRPWQRDQGWVSNKHVAFFIGDQELSSSKAAKRRGASPGWMLARLQETIAAAGAVMNATQP